MITYHKLFITDDTICAIRTWQIYLRQCVGLDESLQLQKC